MDWYYVDNGRRIGPIDDATLDVLVRGGAVGTGTLVWHEGMAEWQPYAAVVRGEGAALPEGPAEALRYAGFWIRVVAKIVDSAILWAAGLAVAYTAAPLLGDPAARPMSAFLYESHPVVTLVQLAMAAAYNTAFVGRYGATPGKMAAGLKVVTPSGGPVGYGTALCRYFAEILSAVILGIGYLMVAFDVQKRALHDRICRTRVVLQ